MCQLPYLFRFTRSRCRKDLEIPERRSNIRPFLHIDLAGRQISAEKETRYIERTILASGQAGAVSKVRAKMFDCRQETVSSGHIQDGFEAFSAIFRYRFQERFVTDNKTVTSL